MPKTEIPFSRTDNGNPVPAQLYTIPEQEDATANYTTYMGGDIGETILQTNRPSLKNCPDCWRLFYQCLGNPSLDRI